MWNLLMISVLTALVGVYANSGERTVAMIETNKARETAEGMALYREAVILYYTAHDVKNYSVSLEVLKTENLVPAWSTLSTGGAGSIWRNYRAADGMIYVYAGSLPPTNIQMEMAELSRYSYLVGVYRQSDMSLYSPVFGDIGISLAVLASKSVPDKAPVWIGHRR
jgi:hypothetical protein